MKVANAIIAEKMLKEAEKMNSGVWVNHSRVVGMCARVIASQCNNLDEDVAYVLGLLHDIGRRDGIMGMRHILCGYNFMFLHGYDDNARICLTHSFPYRDIKSYNGLSDCTQKEMHFIQSFINDIVYDDYDKLIQLCDAISFPDGPVYMEKRLVDVAIRHGFNDLTISKWKAFLKLKTYFDNKVGNDIYKLLNVK